MIIIQLITIAGRAYITTTPSMHSDCNAIVCKSTQEFNSPTRFGTPRDMWRLRSCGISKEESMCSKLFSAVPPTEGCSRCINQNNGTENCVCVKMEASPPSSQQPSCPSPPPARQAPFQWLYTHPFTAAAGASLRWFSAAHPTTLRRQWSACVPRCDPSTPGADAAYPEPIITASAPLVCQLRCQAGASEQPANPLLGSDHDSQSARSFARSDQLKPPVTLLANRMCPACGRTQMWSRKPRTAIKNALLI